MRALRVGSVITSGTVALAAAVLGPASACSSRDAQGVADGGTPAPICGEHHALGPRLWASRLGPRGGTWDGPAVVERSTAEDLVLAFQPTASTFPDGGAGDPALPVHVTLEGLHPMPALPLGARVWLASDPAGAQFYDSPFAPVSPESFGYVAVRDRQGGRLLFGAASHLTDREPVPVGGLRTYCSAPYNDACAGSTTIHYQSVDVLGDDVVTIADGETATVSLGGVPHDVRISAFFVDVPDEKLRNCPEYQTPGAVAIDVQARALSSLVEALDVGPPLACARGNAVFPDVALAINSPTAAHVPYEGPATYARKVDGALVFDVVGIASTAGEPAVLEVYPSGLLAEPSPGEELWASIVYIDDRHTVTALRRSQGGPLLLGTVAASAPLDAAVVAAVQQTLGVAIAAEVACDYAINDRSLFVGSQSEQYVVQLWDVLLGAAPAVRLGSDSTAAITIDGQPLTVWAWAAGSGHDAAVHLTLTATAR